MTTPMPTAREHLDALLTALGSFEIDRLERWGGALTPVLLGGGRLLALGNGGSAAQAQHLTAELVGRYRDDRVPLSAIALHAETSSVTAIANDYGYDEVFARQVAAHGRAGDVLLALSTSGRSRSALLAAERARALGLTTWAMTGPGPNPLTELCDDHLAVDAAATATVQEVHQVAVHLLCRAVDVAVAVGAPDRAAGEPVLADRLGSGAAEPVSGRASERLSSGAAR